jgi:hypothetical protein
MFHASQLVDHLRMKAISGQKVCSGLNTFQGNRSIGHAAGTDYASRHGLE